jgi:hypothetical protein
MGDGIPAVGKRGPGRPRKQRPEDTFSLGDLEPRDPGDAAGEFLPGDAGEGSPAEVENQGTGASGGSANGRKRGRPKKTDRLDLSLISDTLQLVHATVAVATAYRGFELEDSEAEHLAGAVHKLMAHYGKAVSGETSMWLGFAIAIATIEGPKVIGLLAHIRSQKKAPQQSKPNVVPLRPAGDLPPTIDGNAFPTQG